MSKTANVFDPIEDTLDQRVFKGDQPRPSVVSFIERKIWSTLEDTWLDNPRRYFKLFLTGSLTTFQYSDLSDCDISLFPDYDSLMELFGEIDPVQIRKDLITIVTSELDGSPIPGSSHPLQDFVVNPGINPTDLYKHGERSAWSFQTGDWVIPPEKERTHNVDQEMPKAFQRAQDMADKLTVLLDAGETEAAHDFYAQVHKKRSEDEAAGLGDFSEGNIVYKWLLHQGLFDRLNNEAGMHIAKAEKWDGKADGTQICYDYEKDEILIGISAKDHRGSVIMGEYNGKDVKLFDIAKEFVNPNYFKRLWMHSYPTKPIHNVYYGNRKMNTRPADKMTFTEIVPSIVRNSASDWKKGKEWKTWIKNEGIIVDFQFGTTGDDPVEGKVKEIDRNKIKIEVAPGETRVLTNDMLAQIKFKVRDDKEFLSSVQELPAKEAYHALGDCPNPACDYEFTPDDKKIIDQAYGWFNCPQCNRTYNVRTSLGEHKMSWFVEDFDPLGNHHIKQPTEFWGFRYGWINGQFQFSDGSFLDMTHYDMYVKSIDPAEYDDQEQGIEKSESYIGYGVLDKTTGDVKLTPDSYDYGTTELPEFVISEIKKHLEGEGYHVREISMGEPW